MTTLSRDQKLELVALRRAYPDISLMELGAIFRVSHVWAWKIIREFAPELLPRQSKRVQPSREVKLPVAEPGGFITPPDKKRLMAGR